MKPVSRLRLADLLPIGTIGLRTRRIRAILSILGVAMAQDQEVAVSITDDGAGFDPSRAGERHGMGLQLMRDRVAELDGTFRLDSTPGEGTTVRILLPRRSP